MTLAEDFLSDDERSLGADYPEVFGVTITPVIGGVALAAIGLGGAIYIYLNMLAPAQKSYKELQTQVEAKQGELNQIKSGDLEQQLTDLNQQLEDRKALKSRVNALFTNEDDLETLLIDINSFVAARGATLIDYRPDSDISVVQDGSLGEAVNGKLKRKGIALEIEGSFEQTQAILNDLERLQPLLIVKDYSSQISEQPPVVLSVSQKALIPTEATKLKTRLSIDAILPLSQQELLEAREAEEAESKEN
ncbi:MAG: type II and III secretion system protein [Xenococcaceae cyanobacterium]